MLRPERTEFAVNLSVLFTALHNGQVIREHNDENQGSSNDMCRDARNPTTHTLQNPDQYHDGSSSSRNKENAS
jgi:hypothetical protein